MVVSTIYRIVVTLAIHANERALDPQMVLLTLVLCLLYLALMVLIGHKVCYVVANTVRIGTLPLLHTLLVPQSLLLYSVVSIHVLYLGYLPVSALPLPPLV